jgi:hypothetical protein
VGDMNRPDLYSPGRSFFTPTRPLSMAASSSAQPITNPQVYFFFVDFYFAYSSWVLSDLWVVMGNP